MENIKPIAEALVRLSTKEANELVMVMKDEYYIETDAQIFELKEQVRIAEDTKLFRETSPKKYGISLLNRKRKKR